MQVPSATSPFASTAAAATNSSSGTPPVTTNNSLNQADFLQLLSVQFQHQDPMQPMDDTAFIAQMAQFTSLQQSSTLVQQMTQLSASQGIAAANSYLGRQVTLTTDDKQTVTGSVSAVDVSSGTPQLVVNGTSYPVSSVVRIEPDTGASSAAPTTSSVSVKQ